MAKRSMKSGEISLPTSLPWRAALAVLGHVVAFADRGEIDRVAIAHRPLRRALNHLEAGERRNEAAREGPHEFDVGMAGDDDLRAIGDAVVGQGLWRPAPLRAMSSAQLIRSGNRADAEGHAFGNGRGHLDHFRTGCGHVHRQP